MKVKFCIFAVVICVYIGMPLHGDTDNKTVAVKHIRQYILGENNRNIPYVERAMAEAFKNTEDEAVFAQNLEQLGCVLLGELGEDIICIGGIRGGAGFAGIRFTYAGFPFSCQFWTTVSDTSLLMIILVDEGTEPRKEYVLWSNI